MFSIIIPTKKYHDNQDVAKNLEILENSINTAATLIKEKIEIITIGDISSKTSRHIEFSGTISSKINIGVKNSNYEYIVWIRDYFSVAENFFQSWTEFISKNILDVGMNIILNKDGSRFRDWCSYSDTNVRKCSWYQYEMWCKEGLYHEAKPALVPYDYDKTNLMYISGGFLVAKKEFMLKYPFNDSIPLYSAEDVEWSIRARDYWQYRINTGTYVKLSKQKDVVLPEYKGELICQ